jgi:hypothetical protein
MSLLMQALRKAESAKKAQAPDAAAAPEADAAPAPANPPVVPAASSGELTLETLEPTREQRAEAEKAAEEAAEAAMLEPDIAESGPAVAPAPMPAPTAEREPVDYFSGETPPARTPYVPPADPAPVAASDKPAPVPAPEPAPAATAARLKTGTDAQQAMNNANQAAQARQAAGTVFAAKQRAQKRRPLIIGALGLLILSGAGAYGYFQYMNLARPSPFAAATPAGVVAPLPVAVPAQPAVAVVPAPGTGVDGMAPAASADPLALAPRPASAPAAKPAVRSMASTPP